MRRCLRYLVVEVLNKEWVKLLPLALLLNVDIRVNSHPKVVIAIAGSTMATPSTQRSRDASIGNGELRGMRRRGARRLDDGGQRAGERWFGANGRES